MFKVTVLKMKDIIRIFMGITVTVLTILILSKNFRKGNVEAKNKLASLEISLNSLINFNATKCMEQEIPTLANINEKYTSEVKEKSEEKNILYEMLKTEITAIGELEKAESKEDNEKGVDEEKNNIEEAEEIQMAKTGLATEVITNNPITDNSNIQYKNVKIKNETSYNLTEDILNPDITIDNKNVILFHTHSCESYTSSEKYQYTETRKF